MSSLVVGLTGGIASGKSTVARWLAEAGCLVVDADRLVAELYQPGGAGAAAVAALLGPEMLDERGAVDHRKVAARVFGDPEARQALERAIHPLVRRRFEEIARDAPGIAVLEATLLVEAGYVPSFDLVVTVEAPREVRLARAVERGLDPAQAQARLAAQGSGDERRSAVDRILTNGGSLDDLRRQVNELAADLRAMAAAKAAGGQAAPFVLVTANPGKLVEARRLADRHFEAVEIDLPEIQSLDLLHVLRAKAEEAWRRIGRALVVEESGLELAALNGFPGPLVKWMLQAVGAGGIAGVAAALGETRAFARCALLYRDAERTIIAQGVTEGTLVLPPRGCLGFGWDPVFLPAGSHRTFGELAGPEKDAVSHRGKAWRALIEKL